MSLVKHRLVCWRLCFETRTSIKESVITSRPEISLTYWSLYQIKIVGMSTLQYYAACDRCFAFMMMQLGRSQDLWPHQTKYKCCTCLLWHHCASFEFDMSKQNCTTSEYTCVLQFECILDRLGTCWSPSCKRLGSTLDFFFAIVHRDTAVYSSWSTIGHDTVDINIKTHDADAQYSWRLSLPNDKCFNRVARWSD